MKVTGLSAYHKHKNKVIFVMCVQIFEMVYNYFVYTAIAWEVYWCSSASGLIGNKL